jgi:hypothetical protein
MVIEERDLCKRGYVRQTDGKQGVTSHQGLVDSPLLKFSGTQTHPKLIEHICIEDQWYVKVPKNEQKRLDSEWEKREHT